MKPTTDSKSSSSANVPNISGLVYWPDFLSQQTWNTDLPRRVQQYGYAYNYSRGNTEPQPTGTMPQEFVPLMKRLVERKLMPRMPEQCIVNEYTAGQGIAPHIDQTNHFGDTVCSVSLGSAVVMDFEHKSTRQKAAVLLEPCSALSLAGEARYDWLHSIAKRKTDKFGGRDITRSKRISLTFRLMKKLDPDYKASSDKDADGDENADANADENGSDGKNNSSSTKTESKTTTKMDVEASEQKPQSGRHNKPAANGHSSTSASASSSPTTAAASSSSTSSASAAAAGSSVLTLDSLLNNIAATTSAQSTTGRGRGQSAQQQQQQQQQQAAGRGRGGRAPPPGLGH